MEVPGEVPGEVPVEVVGRSSAGGGGVGGAGGGGGRITVACVERGLDFHRRGDLRLHEVPNSVLLSFILLRFFCLAFP